MLMFGVSAEQQVDRVLVWIAQAMLSVQRCGVSPKPHGGINVPYHAIDARIGPTDAIA